MKKSSYVALLAPFLLGGPAAAQATDEIRGSRIQAPFSQDTAEAPMSFQSLLPSIKPGDRVRIEDHAGATITGRLTRLTADEIRMEAGGREQVIASRDVRVVSRIQGSVRRGMLIGLGVMVPLLALSECRGGKNHYCAEGVEWGVILGAGLGACAGGLFPRSTTVYRAGKSEARLAPVLSRHAVGIRAQLNW